MNTDTVIGTTFHIPTNTNAANEHDECSICLEGFHGRKVAPTVVITPCGHRFDLECISKWFNSEPNQRGVTTRTCALCRQPGLPLVREAGAHLYEDSPYCESLPLQAARTGDHKVLQDLLKSNSEIVRQPFKSAMSGSGVGLLYIAAQNGHTECLKALIKAKADLDKGRTSDGATPAFIAAQNGHTECLDALIKAKADLNAGLTANGTTPVYIAAQNGHTQCLNALINAGADLNARLTTDRSTPLHVAAYYGHTECLDALIKAGAELNARMTGGATPADIARQWGHTECLNALIHAGANPNARRTWQCRIQ